MQMKLNFHRAKQRKTSLSLTEVWIIFQKLNNEDYQNKAFKCYESGINNDVSLKIIILGDFFRICILVLRLIVFFFSSFFNTRLWLDSISR